MKNILCGLWFLAAIATTSLLAQTPHFAINPKSDFCFFHISDIQEVGNLHKRSADVLRWALATEKPSLLVLTGDNIDSSGNRKETFEKTIAPFIQIIKEHQVPFAITFGNHDSEKTGTEFYTRQELYDIYKSAAGTLFVDFDIPELSGVGNGKIDLVSQNKTVLELILMDSGDYAGGGYDGVKTDQIAWYEQNSSAPCLWFQHIIVPDINTTGILIPTSADEKASLKLDLKVNPDHASGALLEPTSPPKTSVYTNAEHTYQGRTLYQSWLQKGNLRGAFFGHDHKNTFDGTDSNGIRLGATKALTLHSYNDNNPGLRVFRVKPNGSFSTRILTEADFQKDSAKRTTPCFPLSPEKTFCFLHISDIQETGKLDPRTEAVLRKVIASEKPSLIVSTGDNVQVRANEFGLFEATVAPFLQIIRDTQTPFATTFGNHDSETVGPAFYTRQEIYDYYKRELGPLFVDYDVPELSGVGNGIINLVSQDQTILELILMDSGTYAPLGGYDGVKSDQIEWYETHSSAPCLWFQHIIIPDVLSSDILIPASDEEKATTRVASKINPARGSGPLKMLPRPPKTETYSDPAHTYKDRTLYQSWLQKGNLRGAFFGHDHINAFDATDSHGIRLAATKALTLHSYNDDNPGLRVFYVHPDGSFSTKILSEADLP